MAGSATDIRTELARRSGGGIDVTLVWVHGGDSNGLRVCVCDQREGAYFEIEPEPRLAMEVFHHPYVYRDFSTLDYEDGRLAA